jgi:hypothetical protein
MRKIADKPQPISEIEIDPELLKILTRHRIIEQAEGNFDIEIPLSAKWVKTLT